MVILNRFIIISVIFSLHVNRGHDNFADIYKISLWITKIFVAELTGLVGRMEE